MKKEDLIKLGLDEEIAEKVANASAEELKGFIPKARFDEVNNDKEKLKSDVKERDKQLDSLKNSTDDVEGLQKQIETLQGENKEKEKQHATEIKRIKVDNAISAALNGANAKNEKAVRALLDIDPEKAEFNDDGTVKGLGDQLKSLKEADDSKFLFEEANAKPSLKGATPGETGKETPDDKVDVSKMTYEELAQYMDENPDVEV